MFCAIISMMFSGVGGAKAEANQVEFDSTFVTYTPANIIGFSDCCIIQKAITFPTAFAVPPFVSLTISAVPGSWTFSEHLSFQSPGGDTATCCTWSTMPAAKTELYGRTDNQIDVAFQTFFLCDPVVYVRTAGSINAILRVEGSIDLVNWSDLFTNHINDVAINAVGWAGGTTGFAAINQTFGNGAILRVVGLNGNGIASPQFGAIQLICEQSDNQPNLFTTNVTPTGFTINAYFNYGFSGTITVSWMAFACKDGSRNC
jgi:hypothetical protein